jgi:hypothetical protein
MLASTVKAKWAALVSTVFYIMSTRTDNTAWGFFAIDCTVTKVLALETLLRFGNVWVHLKMLVYKVKKTVKYLR